jgi:hypothetical protein
MGGGRNGVRTRWRDLQVNDKLAFDVAFRDARVNVHTVNELRPA